MQARQLAEVLVALIGLWQLVTEMPLVPSHFRDLADGSLPYGAEMVALQWLIIAALLLFRRRIARYLVPDADSSSNASSLRPMAYAVAGVYVTAYGLCEVVSTAVLLGLWDPDRIVSDAVTILLGLALFVGLPASLRRAGSLAARRGRGGRAGRAGRA